MGNQRPERAKKSPVTSTGSLTARDIEAMSTDFDAPTAELVPSSASGVAQLVQARLRVSEPGDSFENEAESTADAFVRSAHSRSASHNRAASTGVNRSANDDGLTTDSGSLMTTDQAASDINAARGGGAQMTPEVRTRFESFFGSDLGGVRVHDNAQSDSLCRSINAEAFTAGRDVFFTRGAYEPGSTRGDHLIAHELTHVVQQGHAAPISRQATPDVMRDDPPRLTTRTERNPEESVLDTAAGTGGALASLGGAAAGGFGGLDAVNGTMKVATGEGSKVLGVAGSVNATAAVEAGGGLGLFDATAGLINSVTSLMSKWNSHSFDSAMSEGFNAVKNAMSISQKAIQIAAAAGSTIGAAVIPGLGLAIAAVDLVKQIIKAVDLYRAKSAATKKLDELNASKSLTPEEARLQATLTRLRSDANWEMARTVIRIVGDLVIIGGQIGTLAGGVGAPAAVAGAIVVGVAALVGKAQGWSEASAVQDARKAHQADPDSEQLKVERLKVDSFYAACELIKYSAAAIDGTTKKTDAQALNLIKNFGIDDAWLSRYREAKAPESMLEDGAKIICDKLGKDPNPSTFSQDLMKVVGILKTGLVWVSTGVGYILKFTGRVLGVVAASVVGALGLVTYLITKPFLGVSLLDYVSPTYDAVATASDTVGDVVDLQSARHETYFTDETDIRERSVKAFTPIIRTYFAEKKDRGTDVKADSLTSKIKDNYTTFAKMAKNKAPKGKPGFDNESKAKAIIDSVIVDIIKAIKPDRVNPETVKVTDGKVSWEYVGGGKMKTKGFFAGVKNFFGGDKYEKV